MWSWISQQDRPPLCATTLDMLLKVLLWSFVLHLAASADVEFVFNGFRGAELSLDGTATITPEGLLRLTNSTKLPKSHAFYPTPIRFKSSAAGNVSSFSSVFVFGIVPEFTNLSGHGIAFFFSPSKDLRGAIGSQYLGLFSPSTNGNTSNHIVAVELDTIQNPEFADINSNHVGIDIDSLRSNMSLPAGYYPRVNSGFKNLSLISGQQMEVWVEYDAAEMQLNVTLAPLGEPKPITPLLSSTTNLSDVFFESMYVGFSSSSDPFLTSHYIVGWSFRTNGEAPGLNLSSLPALPRKPATATKESKTLAIWLSTTLTVFLLVTVAGTVFIVRRRIKFSEILEDWELEYGASRFSYKDLFRATKGFSDKEILGSGGFGKVYRGVTPKSNAEIAVKRISHDSKQGMKEFVAEIVSIGRLRHRNLVQLLGYSRRKGELLLVYDFMPNGSLDKLLFDQNPPKLDWNQRFRIIKGVASGLLYLHEEWEQVVVHRDIKASNILLDGELNGRLGDFGLARLYDHGGAPRTTHVVGTMGYLAPELAKAGKANEATDVFAFGVFLLEVACGRRPIDSRAPDEEAVLVDWVLACWSREAILEAADAGLSGQFVTEEVELVLRLGLLCCDPIPTVRPSMRQVMQFLEGDVALPEFTSNYMNNTVMSLLENEAWDSYMLTSAIGSTSATVLSEGR